MSFPSTALSPRNETAPWGPVVPKGPLGSHTRSVPAGIAALSRSVAGVPLSPGQDANSRPRTKSRRKDSSQRSAVSALPSARGIRLDTAGTAGSPDRSLQHKHPSLQGADMPSHEAAFLHSEAARAAADAHTSRYQLGEVARRASHGPVEVVEKFQAYRMWRGVSAAQSSPGPSYLSGAGRLRPSSAEGGAGSPAPCA